jgi:hypothetical protein
LFLLLLSGRTKRGTCFLGNKRRAIDPHSVEDDGKFPCQCNYGFLHPGICRPALLCPAFHWPRQDNVRGFKQGAAHGGVADLGDAPRHMSISPD